MKATFFSLLLVAIFALFASEVYANAVPCEQCSPIPKPTPDAQTCDITTSCITVKPNGQYHCACRAGYKSSESDTNGYASFRIPFAGEGYRVFVRPGIACNKLCDHWQLGPYSCQEVVARPECI